MATACAVSRATASPSYSSLAPLTLDKSACLVCGGELGDGTRRRSGRAQPFNQLNAPWILRRLWKWSRYANVRVMAESIDLATRIERLSARASTAPSSDRLLAEIEDLLAVGYLEALSEEAQGRRLAERWEHLAENLDEQDAALEIRRIAVQRRGIDARVALLRDRLGVLRAQFAQLRATSPPA
jgi:hypothetical protein